VIGHTCLKEQFVGAEGKQATDFINCQEKSMRHVWMGALFLGLASSVASADVGVLLKGGTLGAGVDVTKGVSESFGIRLQGNGLSYEDEFTESDVEYDGDIDLRSAGLLLDWHPFSGVFRISAGGYWNGNEVSATGRPTGGTFEINGVTYPASAVGTLDGKIDFDSFAPYLGIGFGSAPKAKGGLSFSLDLGVLYQGEPNVSLTAVCGPIPPASCAQLQSDVAAEEAELREAVKDYKFYPVISIGIGYRF
jgi:hypothetical protein